MPRRWIAIALVAASVGAGRASLADASRAAERYRAAEEAFAHGAFRAAAETFEAAFREDPHAASMYNAGVSWESAGEAARAADDYTVALGMADLAPSQKSDVSTRVAHLEKHLGRLDVTGPSSVRVSVAHVSQAPVPAHVHLAPGNLTLSATYPDGHIETRQVTITVDATATVDLPPVPPTPPPPTLPATESPPEPPTGGSESAAEARPASGTRTAGWIALGASAAFGVAGVVLGLSTLSARDAFDATGDTSESKHDQAVALRTWTNVAWVATGIAAATGVVLLVLPSSSPSRNAAYAELLAVPGGLTLRGEY